MKSYDQYCPVAHACGLLGERWTLLIVRELLQGPKRYTDLQAGLPGVGTNVLAARLKELEAHGVVAKRRLEPPAAVQVYELTPYGLALKPVMRSLALWALQSMGPPTEDDQLAPGWLHGALDVVFSPVAPPGSFEFRIGGEVASLVDGEARRGPAEDPDVVVEGPQSSLYWLFVARRFDEVSVTGDRDLLERLLDDAGAPAPGAAALVS